MNESDINFSKPSKYQLDTLLGYFQAGQYIEAEKLSLSITQEFPEHPFAWKALALLLKRTGKINEALIAIKRSVELDPKDNENHYNLAIILQGLGKFNEAEASYRKAIALKPGHAEAYCNMGVTLQKLGKSDDAQTSYRKAIELKTNYAEAYNNLGATLQEIGKLEEAELNFRKAISLKIDYAEAYNNLAVTLKELEKLDDAEINYIKAISLKTNYFEAYNNFGVTLNVLGKLEEAELNFRKAIALKNNYVEAYTNLGNLLFEKGDVLNSIDCFKKVIKLNPNYIPTWLNLFYPLQVIKTQKLSKEDYSLLFDVHTSSKYTQITKSILKYRIKDRLNRGSFSSNNSLKEVFSMFASDESTFIKNTNSPSSELIKPALPKKITALLHFGRSGTGLLHSLIDNHPEVSTLPSVYFNEFFDHFIWKNIIAGGWEEMANRFTTLYPVLFDASSADPIHSGYKKFVTNIGQKEGLTKVGINRDEILSVDKEIFVKELKKLMNCYNYLDAFIFFKLIHSAYEITLQNPKKKDHIFYHIHNPDAFAQLNFLRLAPNTNWLIMVREPLQCCESWIKKNFEDNNYRAVVNRIITMLFEIDNPIFESKNSKGIRLEDLKKNPKKTMQALCSWLGIKENDSLYEMTAQGKKWWGDPASPDYMNDGSNPFGNISIKRKLGSVFSESDQFIIRTLYYPFSVNFGYIEENLDQFKKDLQSIKPMLSKMFDFEKKIAEQKKIGHTKFMKSGSYLYLRSALIERWNTLNKFNTYPNMLTPLKIN